MNSEPKQRARPFYAGVLALLRNRLFLCITVAPTVIALLYFGVFASDIYVSESRFVIRSPDSPTASPLGLILKGAGFARSQDDSYTVEDFVLSRDALREVDDSLHVAARFADPDVDIFSRFAGITHNHSFESLFVYWKRRVNLELDSTSSIATLTTRAFTAEDAYAINRRLLELSENLVNQLNERGRQDMIRFANDEVAGAAKQATKAALQLAAYRNDKRVIDPEKQSAIPLQQIAKLQDELIADQAQLAQLRQVASENPQIPVLAQRVRLLEAALHSESIGVAGGGASSLAGKAAEYQRLALEKEFSDKLLASAMTSLEEARNEAQRQQLYLERIVEPNKPDKAIEPKRLSSIVVTFIVSLIVWGIVSLLLAGIREHHE